MNTVELCRCVGWFDSESENLYTHTHKHTNLFFAFVWTSVSSISWLLGPSVGYQCFSSTWKCASSLNKRVAEQLSVKQHCSRPTWFATIRRHVSSCQLGLDAPRPAEQIISWEEQQSQRSMASTSAALPSTHGTDCNFPTSHSHTHPALGGQRL